jgi:hypothetical protein
MTTGRGAVQTYVSQPGCAIRQFHPVCSMSQTIWLLNWIVACRRISKEIKTLIIKLLSIQFFRPPFASSPLGPHVLYRTLLSNIPKIVLHEQKSFPKTYTNNKENKSETGSTWAPAPVCRRVLKNCHASDCTADLLTWFPVPATSCSWAVALKESKWLQIK